MSMTVNGVEISDAAIQAEMHHHPAPSRELAEYSAKLALLAKELLLQEAARLEIADDDEEARITALVERELSIPEPDEASCQQFFQTHRQRFRSGDLFEASHILCVAPPDDAAARTAARTQAVDIIARLTEGADFAELAAQRSDCPSKQAGGHLGQIGLGQTVPEFERALMAMQAGETSPQPVESRFGFHVIRLHHKAEGQPQEYSAVRARIAEYLREESQRRIFSQYLAHLTDRAEIVGIELPSAEAPSGS
ncbi:MAG: peptidylprolyl isomerase [Candidatus Competibacteraceae bacterium]|nr:MAG: peptidylprolyl isomerase [Candidatus Competibacteraceae bacterium]